jgi:hypothetical protein
VPRVATDLIELAVGLACVLGAWMARSRPGLRWFAWIAAAAGLAAIGHAAWSLVL